jgi:hypothetical protein
VATEAAWLNGNNLKKKKTKKKEDKMKESLDTHRPSHGRTYADTLARGNEWLFVILITVGNAISYGCVSLFLLRSHREG